MKIILILLLLSSPVLASSIEQCDQACGENRFSNADAKLICIQLCALNVSLQEQSIHLEMVANALVAQNKNIKEILKKEAYIDSVAESINK